jgi:hypothetical protein
MPAPADPLDRLVARLLGQAPYHYAVAGDDERIAAFQLRARAAREQGWAGEDELIGGLERDAHDDRAVIVLGWCGRVPVATGRLVLPPGALPTEEACGMRVEPVGSVVDVGRLVVARDIQDHRHLALTGLLARLYLEVRARGFTVACGLMAAPVRALARQLGINLEVLGEERPYRGALRAPVRFEVAANRASMSARWLDPP